ncbi:MAG: biotin--[acetyl-CoA-carboxylase] ligase [Candidatus Marinimicrobia bacterium]|nr:biotin--[acetyl-CoA-carboxylase] ligase [Candidatus Neomarinimicrobiota bacterium]
MLFINLIEANLTTRRLGREITYYPFTDSTNDDLWELLADGEAAPGQLVITDHQRVGRGRRGRTWSAAPGLGLTFSVLLRPDLPMGRLGLLSLAAGVAVVDALADDEVTALLKWPNDILAEGRKLGGILIESRLVGGAPAVVLGIGLNVNEQPGDFPNEIRHGAIAVRQIRQVPVQRELLLARLLNRLETLTTGDLPSVTALWQDRCAHLGQGVRFHDGEEWVEGQFRGLTSDGQGEIEIGDELRLVTAGELAWPIGGRAAQGGP